MYNTILFDLDGTLTDSEPGIINSIEYALKKYEIIIENKADLRKFLGPPLVESFKQFCGFSEEKAEQAVEFYREYFREKGIFENNVYNGVVELLENLKAKNKKLIVATSKPESFTYRILEHFDLLKYFDFVAGSNMDNTRSKKDEVISYALNSCGITDLHSVVMIGDREHDIIGASKIGIASIGVLYGYGDLKELETAGATYIAKDPREIYEIVTSL
ncbi:MAG: HAD family hydrolase [Eubacterium sp.]|nr:HAD family hydrolase [Eubacterium sp.]